MKFRMASAIALTALITAGATACVPDSSPSPSPTPAFATEAEAFAAAEATYRAYIDALNAVDLADPDTFEPVFQWTTGEANAQERKSLSSMHADNWTVGGATDVLFFTGQKFAGSQTPEVTATACIDLSSVTLVDRGGASQVTPGRPSSLALELQFSLAVESTTGLVISASTAVEDDSCVS